MDSTSVSPSWKVKGVKLHMSVICYMLGRRDKINITTISRSDSEDLQVL